MARLAEAVARAAEAHTVATAIILPHGGREEYADFLEAVDHVLTAEHQATQRIAPLAARFSHARLTSARRFG